MITEGKRAFCVLIFGCQKLVVEDEVFNMKISGKNNIEKDKILDAKKLLDLENIEESPEGSVPIKVLSVRYEKGIAFKKNRRKRFQKKIGFRKTVLTLKALKV